MASKKDKHPYYATLSQDPIMKPLLDTLEVRLIKKHSNICLRLCASIMSQQLSTKVADVIFKRFLALYAGEEPTAQQIKDTPHETLRAIGLSNAKVSYMHNVAAWFLENKVTDKTLEKMSDEEVITALTQIKGVGRWTAEMLLMFTLGRQDVFSPDDLGIMQGMAKLYGLDTDDKKELKKQMCAIAENWSPYRTFACLYIWHAKDNN